MHGLEVLAYVAPAFVAGYVACLLTSRQIARRERRAEREQDERTSAEVSFR